ncbi:uncharacterized protein LOC121379696 [Gigantopelta aegis]|uniref:uncharacterized protein LOC121379696 n=1 Tax=Gigantopelta aegis TaxID=1735272 RepID=UPI001B88913B|nr:uncharacterized protein LOC121379696 [Gigantopelta aegis]
MSKRYAIYTTNFSIKLGHLGRTIPKTLLAPPPTARSRDERPERNGEAERREKQRSSDPPYLREEWRPGEASAPDPSGENREENEERDGEERVEGEEEKRYLKRKRNYNGKTFVGHNLFYLFYFTERRATCPSDQCEYPPFCLTQGVLYSIGGKCVKCNTNGNDLTLSCLKAPHCWKQGTSVYQGTCYKCSADLQLTEECHVCGTDTCLPKDGSNMTVGDMTYICGSAAQPGAPPTTVPIPTTPLPSSGCSCILTINNVNYTITNGETKKIECDTWKCEPDASGTCAPSVDHAGCKRDNGSCAAVGIYDACNKECQTGSYGMGKWAYTKCKFADGTCVDVGSSLHCYTCQPDHNLKKTGCKSASGECFDVNEQDGCNICKADFSWNLRCDHDDSCLDIGATATTNCVTYECQSNTVGQTTSYGMVETSRKCRSSAGACLNTGDVDGCSVCKANGTFDIKCEDSSGGCYNENESKTTDCITYTCTVSGNSYALSVTKKECLNGGECFPEGHTFEFGCKQKICSTTGTSVGFIDDPNGPVKCNFAGTCLTPGQTKDCHLCKADGHMDWKCKDSNGNCHNNGDTWDTCSCTISGNSANITCT